jgi:hypothetical protein
LVSHDWSKIRFLESTENLKAVVHQSTGREPPTAIALDIAACLQQGRLFFEIAADAPLQIKPLQIYYGIVGFAKAIILARRVRSISTLAQSHGLRDISQQNTNIEGMTLQFHGSGLFSQFNDTVAQLGRLSYYDETSNLQFIPKPFDASTGLVGTRCTLKDVLSRVPGLQRLYEKTFNETPASCHIQLFHQWGGSVQLRIDDPSPFTNRDDLKALVEKWRLQFPFLREWCFYEAGRAWGNSILLFRNTTKPSLGELSPAVLVEANNGFGSPNSAGRDFVPFETIVPSLAGGITIDHTVAIRPLNDVSLSEYALQFCGAFLLSSLVRYRPQIWQHALSHSALGGRSTDDRSLSLIEKFLDIVSDEFPKLVEKTIDWANSHDQRV